MSRDGRTVTIREKEVRHKGIDLEVRPDGIVHLRFKPPAVPEGGEIFFDLPEATFIALMELADEVTEWKSNQELPADS